ncbi:hypothetical protein SISSUDRAFT_1070343 [Sistotremastrum suecicum HHB10207 ss-3]|uniref:Uncharacterized protein n=1 Tax=Sistotremastrum suecicum HHB10207 ss-3 TaxID=1314776 RepID=A0A166EWI8_9AGAM|nr:hypothetical protein SISSUDRAFT_1070343 [Sistotremastrum suecicum HHB10207 ss-3]
MIVWSGGDLPGPPPTYERLIAAEKALPQHNLDLPFPEGRNGRYVKFTNQIKGLGWNNVMNEVLLCSHLAWRAKRAYVFQDYVWKVDYYPWRTPNWPWPRMPLTALIAGPTAGGPWEADDLTPRSVREDHWEKVCPPEDTEIIDSDVAKGPIRDAPGNEVMDHWVKLLTESTKRCVEVVPTLSGGDMFPQTFDLWLMGSSRLTYLWPEISQSPISRLLGTSPLVNSAVDRNEHLFLPKGSRPSFDYDPYSHMMAIHLRRGDFHEACTRLANYNSTFYGWNLLPELLDPFTPPGGDWEIGANTPENIQVYLERCLPTNEYLIKKIHDSKVAWENGGMGRKLDIMFIMTNAKKDWLDEFKKALKASGWTTIISTQDLVLDDEQLGVGMAVDMDIGRRAAAFIGNGWSSLTSNVLHRRLVDGKQPLANRFW